MAALKCPRFELSLLGRFELVGPGGPVDLNNKKLAGLLAFMACNAGKPQSRERLTTLFWGSHFETQARQNLRQALLRLRRVLGDRFHHDSLTVAQPCGMRRRTVRGAYSWRKPRRTG
jgi:DNA-binding SARP family transcriptional activator